MKTDERSSLGSRPLASPKYTGPKLVSHRSRTRQMFPRGYSRCFSRSLTGWQRNELVLMRLASVVLRVGGVGSRSASCTVEALIMSVPLRSCRSARELLGCSV